MEIKLEIPFTEIVNSGFPFYRKKEINVKREIGFRFDMLSWWKVCDINNIEIDEMANIEEAIGRDMAFASHFSYCIKHGEPIKYSLEEGQRWALEMSSRDAKEFIKAMLNSKILGKTTEQWGKESKKKLPGKT